MEEKDLKTMVHEIHKALVGDEYGSEGLVNTVKRHDKKLGKIDRYIYGIIGAYAFLIFILMYGSTILHFFERIV